MQTARLSTAKLHEQKKNRSGFLLHYAFLSSGGGRGRSARAALLPASVQNGV